VCGFFRGTLQKRLLIEIIKIKLVMATINENLTL
jgi:hypothetical protein